MKRYKLDLMLSGFVIIFSLILIIFIIPTQIRVPENLKGTYLSPAAFPWGYSVFLLIMGVILLATTIFSKKMLEEEEEKEEKKAEQNGAVILDEKKKKESFLIAVKLWIIFIIFMILLQYMGILISSIIFMCFTILYFGNGSKIIAICFSILVPVFLYSFFRFVGGVPLFNGILFKYFF